MLFVLTPGPSLYSRSPSVPSHGGGEGVLSSSNKVCKAVPSNRAHAGIMTPLPLKRKVGLTSGEKGLSRAPLKQARLEASLLNLPLHPFAHDVSRGHHVRNGTYPPPGV